MYLKNMVLYEIHREKSDMMNISENFSKIGQEITTVYISQDFGLI
jgi:hypothetical protein